MHGNQGPRSARIPGRRRIAPLPDRRQFIAAAAGVAAGTVLGPAWTSSPAGKLKEETKGLLKVTDVEVHDITVPYADWIAYELNHYYGPTRRTVYVVHTDKGLIGLGEGGREPDTVVQK